jgi:hypothetical protein
MKTPAIVVAGGLKDSVVVRTLDCISRIAPPPILPRVSPGVR